MQSSCVKKNCDPLTSADQSPSAGSWEKDLSHYRSSAPSSLSCYFRYVDLCKIQLHSSAECVRVNLGVLNVKLHRCLYDLRLVCFPQKWCESFEMSSVPISTGVISLWMPQLLHCHDPTVKPSIHHTQQKERENSVKVQELRFRRRKPLILFSIKFRLSTWVWLCCCLFYMKSKRHQSNKRSQVDSSVDLYFKILFI